MTGMSECHLSSQEKARTHEQPSVVRPDCCRARVGAGLNRPAIGEGQFQHNTPDIRGKGPMHLAGRTSGIMAGFEPQGKGMVVQTSAHDEYFLGIRMALAA